jgi:hypothetical protein
MVDIEALGGDYYGPIISIGVCMFNKDGIVADSLEERQLNWWCKANYEAPGVAMVDLSTVKWWMEQVAKGNHTPIQDGEHPLIVASWLMQYLERWEPDLVWAKDPDYDVDHLATWLETYEYEWPLMAYKGRSVRTLFDLAKKKDHSFSTRPAEGTAHTALADAVFQAEQVLEAYRVLGVNL